MELLAEDDFITAGDQPTEATGGTAASESAHKLS